MLVRDVAQLVAEHTQNRVVAVRDIDESVQQHDGPPRQGKSVHSTAGQAAKLEPILDTRRGLGRCLGKLPGYALAVLRSEAAGLEIVLVEGEQHLLAHTLLDPRGQRKGRPSRRQGQALEVGHSQQGHESGQGQHHRRPPTLQPNHRRDGGARVFQGPLTATIRVFDLHRRAAGKPDEPGGVVEGFGQPGPPDHIPVEHRSVRRLHRQGRAFDAQEDRRGRGAPSVEAHAGKASAAHIPRSNPNVSRAPSPAAVTGIAWTSAATTSRGRPAYIRMHSIR